MTDRLANYIPAKSDWSGLAAGSHEDEIERELENLGVIPGSQDADRLILSLLRAEWDRRHGSAS